MYVDVCMKVLDLEAVDPPIHLVNFPNYILYKAHAKDPFCSCKSLLSDVHAVPGKKV